MLRPLTGRCVNQPNSIKDIFLANGNQESFEDKYRFLIRTGSFPSLNHHFATLATGGE